MSHAHQQRAAPATSSAGRQQLSANGLPIELQQRLDGESQRRTELNQRLINNILDMALVRIRHHNEQFRDAELVGAAIRVRTNVGGIVNPTALMQLPRVEKLLAEMSGTNAEVSQGIMQDLMMSDMITRMRMDQQVQSASS